MVAAWFIAARVGRLAFLFDVAPARRWARKRRRFARAAGAPLFNRLDAAVSAESLAGAGEEEAGFGDVDGDGETSEEGVAEEAALAGEDGALAEANGDI